MFDIDDYTVLSLDDICECLSIGRHAASTLLNNGDIEAFRVGHVWKIPYISYKEFVNRSRKKNQASK